MKPVDPNLPRRFPIDKYLRWEKFVMTIVSVMGKTWLHADQLSADQEARLAAFMG